MKARKTIITFVACALLMLLAAGVCVSLLRPGQGGGLAVPISAAGALLLLAAILVLQWHDLARVERERQNFSENKERLRLAMQHLSATIWDYDLKTHEIIQSGDSIKQHGFQSVVPDVPESLIACGFVHPESVDAFRAMYDELFAGAERAGGIFRMQTADRMGWWYEEIQYVNLFDKNGRPYRAIGMSQNVTEKCELKTAAQSDSLTGLLNHNTTVERVRQRIDELNGEGGALFVVDLDFFKQLNDALGHQAGDETLVRIAAIIRENFRAEDVVGRIGGDEFLIFLCSTHGLALVRRKAQQLIQALQVYCGDAQNGVTLSASVGVALCRSGDDFGTLYRRADRALYTAKERGRNQFCIDEVDDAKESAAQAALSDTAAPADLSPIQLQALLAHMDGGVLLFEVGETLKMFYRSPGFRRLADSIGHAGRQTDSDLLLMVADEDREALETRLRQGARSDTPVDASYRVRTSGGELAWRHIRAVRIAGEQRENPVMVAVITDISELKKTDAMLNAIVENSPLGIGVFDLSAGFRPVFVNQVLLTMFRFSREEFFGQAAGDALSMVDRDEQPMLRELIGRAMQSDHAEEVVYHPAHREGIRRRSIRANGLRIRGAAGEPLLLIMFNDITDQLPEEADVPLSAGIPLPELVAEGGTPEFGLALRRRILVVEDNKVNRMLLCKILSSDYEVFEASNGREALELLQREGERLSAVLLDLAMPVMDGYELLTELRADPALAALPVIVTTGNGAEDAEVRALACGANDFVLKPYKPAVIRQRLDNAIRMRETSAIVTAVEKDELTGAYSRGFFYRRAENALRSGTGQRFDVVCCDIERFKLINELFGTQTGDRLLRRVADLLIQQVAGRGICGRIGADRFATLIPHREHYDNETFEPLIRAVNTPPFGLEVALSYGICVADDPALPVSTLCDRALTACNSVKGRYGVHFAYYDDSFHQRALMEQLILDGMKTGLSEHQFQVYYQPKYSLVTETVVGAEALVRWLHPERGLLSPAEFIPLFERNGFITDLDLYVWETACQDLSHWIGSGHSALPVSVNVSRTDIYNPNLGSILTGLVQKYGLRTELLHLEITESAYSEDSEQLVQSVVQLRDLGFSIEMDDFGTGYSSLNMLSRLPISVLKLDRGFIDTGTDDNQKQSVLDFTINLARRLELPVVAEGVETREQATQLREMGCGYAQGYYYARPMPRAAFEKLLAEAEQAKPCEAGV